MDKKKLFGGEVSVDEMGMLSATEAIKLGNAWRISQGQGLFSLSQWFSMGSVKVYVNELVNTYGPEGVKRSSRGRGGETWVHPLLFVKLILDIDHDIDLQEHKWIINLAEQYKDDFIEDFKAMCGELFIHTNNKQRFYKEIEALEKRMINHFEMIDYRNASNDKRSRFNGLCVSIKELAAATKNNEKAIDEAFKLAK